jgi:hypothetical protein
MQTTHDAGIVISQLPVRLSEPVYLQVARPKQLLVLIDEGLRGVSSVLLLCLVVLGVLVNVLELLLVEG